MKPVTRRTVMAGAAAVAVVPFNSKADVPGEDAELRRLWAQYVVQNKICNDAWDTHRQLREASGYDAEFDALKPDYQRDFGTLHSMLWKKYGLGATGVAASREHRKCLRLVKAIRKVRAESPFGVGVKLSTLEDWRAFDEYELAEIVDDVRRDLAALTGVDFIAATGELLEEAEA
jgi:hypothetical protein